jgi:hypothetical protein
MKKGALRTTSVNGKKYKWIVDENEVRIYDESKKLYRIEKSIIYSITNYEGYENNWPDYGSVRPAMVRIWIGNNIREPYI